MHQSLGREENKIKKLLVGSFVFPFDAHLLDLEATCS